MKKRIVIIDDEPQVCETLQKILQRFGYDVVTAENGNIGIELVKSCHTDLVITDLTMPEKDGMETIRELQIDYPELSIIAMSGGSDRFPKHFLEKAVEAGAVRSLTKPFRKDEILQAIEEVLSKGDKPASRSE